MEPSIVIALVAIIGAIISSLVTIASAIYFDRLAWRQHREHMLAMYGSLCPGCPSEKRCR